MLVHLEKLVGEQQRQVDDREQADDDAQIDEEPGEALVEAEPGENEEQDEEVAGGQDGRVEDRTAAQQDEEENLEKIFGDLHQFPQLHLVLDALRVVKLNGKTESVVELAVCLGWARRFRTAVAAIDLIVADQSLVESLCGRIVDSLRDDEEDQCDDEHDEITDEQARDVQGAQVCQIVQAEDAQQSGQLTAVVLELVFEVRIEEQKTLKEHMSRTDQGGDREDGLNVQIRLVWRREWK